VFLKPNKNLGASVTHCAATTSIFCLTYNHAPFIRQCLDGFLLQKTDFPLEAIIHDDASTDGTDKIVQEYAELYPSFFRLALQSTNHWPDTTSIFKTLKCCSGEFVAICEGDDYWTDPLKLQTQVDLLKQHPHASGVFHRADDLVQAEEQFTAQLWGPKVDKFIFEMDDLLRSGTFAPTASLVFRRDCIADLPLWGKCVPHGDFGLLAFALLSGPMLYIPKSMSVYRRHEGGVHSTTFGPVASLRAIQSLVHVGHDLGLQNEACYLEGLRWRLSEMAESVEHQRKALHYCQNELDHLRKQMERSSRSRWYRVGVLLDKLIKTLKVR
jgi:glycosyltransferase involved in cell wall biosynthesis